MARTIDPAIKARQADIKKINAVIPKIKDKGAVKLLKQAAQKIAAQKIR